MSESFEQWAKQRIGANVWGVTNDQYDLARDAWYASRGEQVPEEDKARHKHWRKLPPNYNCPAVTVIADCNACGGRECGQTKELMAAFFERRRVVR